MVSITDINASMTSQQRYLPFGGVRLIPNSQSLITDFGYTGQRNLDEDIGLMDYRARFYSPVLNRFIQPDSIVPGMYNPQNLNRFSYVVNNPINLNDPTGHAYCDFIDNNNREDCEGGLANSQSSSVIWKKKNAKGDRGGRDSGEQGEVNPSDTPPHPDPTVRIMPLISECAEGYTLVQCAYTGGYYNPLSSFLLDSSEFNELLIALYYDLKLREPVGGYDSHRQFYDTPLWDHYGEFNGKVCIDFGDCYERSEVNYVAQGMWVAASDQSKAEGIVSIYAWKIYNYREFPTKETLEWYYIGYDIYNVLESSYPYPP